MTAGIDTERIRQKLAFILQQAADLRRLPDITDKEMFIRDPWLVRGAKYALQTAIEAMIDTAYHLAARAFTYAPADARDALAHLEQRGVFSPEEASSFQEMVRFRNRVVHGYDNVDEARIYDIISLEIDDFERFITAIERFLKKITETQEPPQGTP